MTSAKPSGAATICNAIRGAVTASGSQLFLLDPRTGHRFSYGEWLGLCNRLADRFAHDGVQRGERIAIVLPYSWELAAFYFACLIAGTVAVPITPDSNPAMVALLIRGTRPKAIYANDLGSLDDVELTGTTVIQCAIESKPQSVADSALSIASLLGGTAGAEVLSRIEGRQQFSVTFTSGTTEQPKGVAHTVGSLFGNAIAFNSVYEFGAATRMAHLFPMHYMAGFLNTLLSPFVAGGSAVLMGPFGPLSGLTAWRQMRNTDVTAMWASPTMLSAIMSADRDPDGASWARDNLGTVCVGTAPLPLQLKLDFETKYGVQLSESYGSSELLYVSAVRPNDPHLPGSVGQFIGGVSGRFVGHEGTQQNPARGGELLLCSEHAFAGYMDFASGEISPFDGKSWFETGDLGRIDHDQLFITGRAKDLIVRGGANVSPRAIEEVLHRNAHVQAAAVIGVPDPFYGEEVLAVIHGQVTESGRTELMEELRLLCEASLPAADCPRHYEFVDQMPRNETGKILKKELRERFANQLSRSRDTSRS